jgi:catechol 2,3-dioxygenase-like lactoylglutathione lyase family enzyme
MTHRREERNPMNKIKKTRYLDHIDLRVNDLERAYKFYSKLLPSLGFVRDRSSGRWGIFYAAGGDKPEAFFGFIQNRCHQVNGTRLARKIGAKNLEGPELCPYYNSGYYACFFEDPAGNKLEVCSRENPIIPA